MKSIETHKERTERVARLMELDGPIASEEIEAYRAYCDLLELTTTQGRIGQPKWIRRLYPILLEIKDEMDEDGRKHQLREKRRENRRKYMKKKETNQIAALV